LNEKSSFSPWPPNSRFIFQFPSRMGSGASSPDDNGSLYWTGTNLTPACPFPSSPHLGGSRETYRGPLYTLLCLLLNVYVNNLKIAFPCFRLRTYFLKAGAKIETYF